MPSIKTWTGALTKVYETAGNWSSAGKPGSGDQVLIDSSSWTQGPPNAPVGAETVASLTVDGSAFTFTGGGNLTAAAVVFGVDGNVTNQARATNLIGVDSLTIADARPAYLATITFNNGAAILIQNGGFIASITKAGAITITVTGSLILGLLGDVTLGSATITVQDSTIIGVLGNTDLNCVVTGTITGPGLSNVFLSILNNVGTLTASGFGPAYKVGVGATQVGTYLGTVTIPAVGQVSNGVHFGPDGGLTGTAGPGMINIGAGS